LYPSCSIPGELQQKIFFMAPMGNMPHMIRQKISVCSRHICLQLIFGPKKGVLRRIYGFPEDF